MHRQQRQGADIVNLAASRKANRTRTARSKIIKREDAAQEIRKAKRRGDRVVFTNGCFDLLHVGHIRSLEQARGLGDRLIVAVNSDASVRKLKGDGRPIVPARQRAEMIAALGVVDWVVVFPAATPLALIKALRPDVLAKGGDWKPDEIVGASEVKSWGGRVVRLREIAGVRTTSLIDRVLGEGLPKTKPAAAATRKPQPRRRTQTRRTQKP
ncbi:MAG: rfaE bifunctional protein nucleotidyltransferase chain/domain [Myxococcota bacterium]|jgi:rfaE bifunctional protein nucleotidyltransferase chain/domain